MSGRTDAAGPIVLIGLPGVGKTSVARALARRLGRSLRDADAEIERAAGTTIREIFAREGEAGFRARERQAIAAIERASDAPVVALGGGAVAAPETERWLRGLAHVVWLDAPVEQIAARLEGTRDRPLLDGCDGAALRDRLARLRAQRSPAYARCATWRIETAGRTPEAIATEIAARLQPGRRVRLDLGDRAHDIVIEAGLSARLGEQLRVAGLAPGPCALVCCERVEALYGERLRAGLRAAGFEPLVTVVPAGEAAKRLATVEDLCRRWRAARLDRAMGVLAVGGGAVTDVAGFAAAVYRRGLPWVACPTTLLGMVDAAIGGKTGVNLERTKNLVGAIWQPVRVVIDPLVLETLPARELRSGWGEVLKYALIGPEPIRAQLAAGGHAPPAADRAAGLGELIAACAACKAAVVAEDERESGGRRKVLNFGHTVGHAIEAAVAEGAVTHGECVVLGMRAALELSEQAGLLDVSLRSRLERWLSAMGWPAAEPPALEAVLEQLAHDKKAAGGVVCFVLLAGLGEPRVDCALPPEQVRAATARVLERWRAALPREGARE